jgi:hypothetical protein
MTQKYWPSSRNIIFYLVLRDGPSTILQSNPGPRLRDRSPELKGCG